MNFSLRATLTCGQFFRWFERDGWFYVRHRDVLFRAREPFCIEGLDSASARRFFALDHDYTRILSSFPKDDALRRAIDEFHGLRILRQDPYECLLSFMVSICSNIPRITRDLDSIARTFGSPIRFNGVTTHRLPPSETPLRESPLRRANLGFRARYLAETQRRVSGEFLRDMAKLDFEAAREALCELPGVGVKVAECVLLFAYGRLEAFPIDTWIRKVMTRLYKRRKADREIAAFARDHFGPYAGYAQQFLYAWSRAHRL